MRRVVALGLVLALGVVAGAAPADPGSEFVLDLTDMAGEPLALVLATKGKVWQLPNHRLRAGRGLALLHVLDAGKNRTSGRVFIEIEPSGGRPLETFVEEVASSMRDRLRQGDGELEGEVLKGAVRPVKLGRHETKGAELSYGVRLRGSDAKEAIHALTLVCTIGSAVMAATIENHSADKAFVGSVVKSLGVVKLASVVPPAYLKLVDATEDIFRYVLGRLPSGLLADTKDLSVKTVARFRRQAAAAGAPAARLEIDCENHRSDFDFEKEAAEFASGVQDYAEEISPLSKIRVGGLDGLALTYRERDDRDKNLVFWSMQVHFKVVHQRWTLTFSTPAADEAARKKDEEEFRRFVQTLAVWTAGS